MKKKIKEILRQKSDHMDRSIWCEFVKSQVSAEFLNL